MPWQAQLEQMHEISGAAWYRRYFSVDPDSLRSVAASAAILHFGAVDYHATVWLNGKRLGEHEGGYLPFEFNIIDQLHEGDNELLVRVVDSTDDRRLSKMCALDSNWSACLSGDLKYSVKHHCQ